MKRLTLPEPRQYVLIDEARIRWDLLCGLNLLTEHPNFPLELRAKVRDLFLSSTEKPGAILTNERILEVQEAARRASWEARFLGPKDAELLAGCVMMVLSSITDCMQTKQSRKYLPWSE
jgi:hypothetical protein